MTEQILSEIVAIPSVSGQEESLASYTAERCRGLGRSVLRLGNNVAVHIPGTDRSRALIFNGHLDTVPPSDKWAKDPYTLTPDGTDEDRLIGLGASDMGAGLAAMLRLAQETTLHHPPCDIWLLFSGEEETTSSGSVQVTEWLAQKTLGRYKTIGGIILEPTNAQFVGVGHRESTIWQVTARGPGGHASQNLSDHAPALEKISRFTAALADIRQAWADAHTDPILGSPSIQATLLHAGTAPNVIPLEASATYNLRVTPGLAVNLPQIRSELERKYDMEIYQPWEPAPSVCDANEYIYKTMKIVLPHSPFKAFPGATDRFAFEAHGIPMLIYGPGDVEAMHKPDEWVRKSAMVTCEKVIAKLVKTY